MSYTLARIRDIIPKLGERSTTDKLWEYMVLNHGAPKHDIDTFKADLKRYEELGHIKQDTKTHLWRVNARKRPRLSDSHEERVAKRSRPNPSMDDGDETVSDDDYTPTTKTTKKSVSPKETSKKSPPPSDKGGSAKKKEEDNSKAKSTPVTPKTPKTPNTPTAQTPGSSGRRRNELELPPGWRIEDVERMGGASKGRFDRYWYSPDNVKFRSIVSVERFLASEPPKKGKSTPKPEKKTPKSEKKTPKSVKKTSESVKKTPKSVKKAPKSTKTTKAETKTPKETKKIPVKKTTPKQNKKEEKEEEEEDTIDSLEKSDHESIEEQEVLGYDTDFFIDLVEVATEDESDD